MKYRTLLLIVCALILNCPKSHKPKVDRIEITYLSSLYQDIASEKPLLAGIKETEGITLGHIVTEPRYTAVLLGEFGFFDLLSKTGIDYIIADPQTINLDNVNYFIVPYNLGYVISNYEGIRFALLSKGKDSLTIQDQITVEIVNQRSDIMWIIEPGFLASPPKTYYFYVRNRGLADTSTATFTTSIDTLLAEQLHDCARRVQDILSRSITLTVPSIKEFTLSTAIANEQVDIILYPSDLFKKDLQVTTLTISDFTSAVACEQHFQKAVMSRSQVEHILEEQRFMLYGDLKDGNQVLYPAVQGKYLFEMLDLITLPPKY